MLITIVFSQSDSAGDIQPLRLAHVGGVFVVLVGGCIFATLIAFSEVFLKSREVVNKEGVSIEMSAECSVYDGDYEKILLLTKITSVH